MQGLTARELINECRKDRLFVTQVLGQLTMIGLVILVIAITELSQFFTGLL